jgi:hypothetical protein
VPRMEESSHRSGLSNRRNLTRSEWSKCDYSLAPRSLVAKARPRLAPKENPRCRGVQPNCLTDTRCQVVTRRAPATTLCCVARHSAVSSGRNRHRRGGGKNEHLDNIVRSFADRMAGRFHGVSCRRRTDTSAVGVRGDLVDSALCDGKSHCLSAGDQKPPSPAHRKRNPRWDNERVYRGSMAFMRLSGGPGKSSTPVEQGVWPLPKYHRRPTECPAVHRTVSVVLACR